MTISESELVTKFGAAAAAHNGSVFVGAGLSRGAGLPDWAALVGPLRREAKIPVRERDLALVAEYYENGLPGGRERLESELAKSLAGEFEPTEGHRHLERLPVTTFWTTNYDRLLETAVSDAFLVIRDEDLLTRDIDRRRVIKLHGSLGPTGWDVSPVISRTDFESYEACHPRMWAALRATYLTQAMLFLGFSFDDPNVEVLQRLARTTLDLGAPEHFTVMRRPTSGTELALHEHRLRDLNRSGVAVCEIGDFTDLVPILRALVRRTRPRQLFLAGSHTNTDPARLNMTCQALAAQLASDGIILSSLSLNPPCDLLMSRC